jgi:hypothetical protein|tara:strand:- start:45 stop:290 length:246 start_codon:yes stop_codon:yes gene_type:complete
MNIETQFLAATFAANAVMNSDLSLTLEERMEAIGESLKAILRTGAYARDGVLMIPEKAALGRGGVGRLDAPTTPPKQSGAE